MSMPRQIAEPQRADLSNRAILLLAAGALLLCGLFLALRNLVPVDWSRPELPLRYLAGVAGAVLLTGPYVFALGKRSGALSSPPRSFVIHALSGYSALVLLVIHSGGHFDQAPALLLLLALFLVLQGSWARVVMSRGLSSLFGSAHRAFVHDLPVDRSLLAELIADKVRLLETLDPAASEALFSPTLRHWLRAPLATLRYTRLGRHERRIVNAHRPLAPAQRYWRVAHIAAACILLAGMILHVVLVLFFAGYVAGGEPVPWWHVANWSFGQSGPET